MIKQINEIIAHHGLQSRMSEMAALIIGKRTKRPITRQVLRKMLSGQHDPEAKNIQKILAAINSLTGESYSLEIVNKK